MGRRIYKTVARCGLDRSLVERFADQTVVTTEMLLSTVSGTLQQGLQKRVGTLIEERGLWKQAMELIRTTENNPNHTAFRMVWALEWARMIDHRPTDEMALQITDDFINLSDSSVQRIYAKMIVDMIGRGVLELDDRRAEELATRSFDLLIDRSVNPAVKVWAIDILTSLSGRIDWVADNLTQTVQQLSTEEECKRSIAAAARHFLGTTKHKRPKGDKRAIK